MQKELTSNELCRYLEDKFSASCDFALRKLELPCKVKVYAASIIGLCDKAYISEFVIEPLFELADKKHLPDAVFASKLVRLDDSEKASFSILSGNVVVFFDLFGELYIFATDARAQSSRSISEPEGEVVIRGPREGFVESAVMNVALLRKRLVTEKLRVEKTTVGNISPTEIYIVYIDGIADKKVIERIKQRLSKIDLPTVIDSGYIEHSLGDSRYPLFPDVGNSEKPDKVAAKLVGGRVAVVCDGSPCVLTLPYFFVESIQSAEDYLKSPYYASFLRILRVLGTLIAVFLPGIYIALLEFDVSAIPHTLYMTITEARNDIPFTPFTELVVLLFVFEIIREVGVRMPRAVGDAVSIVAGIILGDAAIKAGIASAPVIMVAALSATCNFIDPPIMNALPLIRLANLVFARIFGLFGVAFFMLVLAAALCVKTSAGKPYLLPFVPTVPVGLLDGIIAVPDLALKRAPDETEGK
ncbi:MAG: spore germination protein [Ruminococcaceae bacterium]|nr:spore germination protein [Oscillospiraceae bacterium]